MTATDTHQPGHRAGFFVALLFPLFKELPDAGTGPAERRALPPPPLSVRHLGLVNPSRFELPMVALSTAALLAVGCRACHLSATVPQPVALLRFCSHLPAPTQFGLRYHWYQVSPL